MLLLYHLLLALTICSRSEHAQSTELPQTHTSDQQPPNTGYSTAASAALPIFTSWKSTENDQAQVPRDTDAQVSAQDGPPTVIPVGSSLFIVPEAPQGPPTVIPVGSSLVGIPAVSSKAPEPPSTITTAGSSAAAAPAQSSSTVAPASTTSAPAAPAPSSPVPASSSQPEPASSTSSVSSTTTPRPPSISSTPSVPTSVPSSPMTTDLARDSTCWFRDICKKPLTFIAKCYEEAGPVVDPNSRSDQSKKYQACLCTNEEFKHIALRDWPGVIDNDLTQCIDCLGNHGIDTTSTKSPAFLFKWKLNDFCNTRDPNTYDLLRHLIVFVVGAARVPAVAIGIPSNIATITYLDPSFKSTPGMNVPTIIQPGVVRPTPTPSGLWWERTLAMGDPIPTEYLAQLPHQWPYTEYAMQAKVGSTTKWPLTDPNRTESTVAWVYASVLWNPRPLVTKVPEGRKMREGEVWQPLLDGWMQGFITAFSTNSGPPGVSRSRSGKSTVPMTTTRPSSSMGGDGGTSRGVRPSVTQSAVLSKDPDARDSVSIPVRTSSDMGGRGIRRFAFPTRQVGSRNHRSVP